MRPTTSAWHRFEKLAVIEPDQKERIAVLEHRADGADKAIIEIRGFAQEIRDSNKQLVRIATNQEHMQRQIDRLEEKLENEKVARLAQHDQTRAWAANDASRIMINTSWREWAGRMLIGVICAGLALLGRALLAS